MLDKIAASGWHPCHDSQLQLNVPTTPAVLRDRFRHREYSELEMLMEIFGSWLEIYVLPPLNVMLGKRHAKLEGGGKRRYNMVSKNQLFRYFLYRFLCGLEKHQKHNIRANILEQAKCDLIGVNRADAIHACLDFGDHTLTQIVGHAHVHLAQFVAAGSTSCVDETIFPHYGKKAFDQGKLQCIKGKPFDYGMVAYLLAQPLLFSRLPICLAICPTFLGSAPKPIDAALWLFAAVPAGVHFSFSSKHLIVDSLWSAPVHLDLYLNRQILFTVVINANNSYLPGGFIDLASDDLPTGASRTYSNGVLVLQVTASDNGITAVITGAWKDQSSEPPPVLTKGTYETAQYLFTKETPDSIVRMFNLDPALLQKSKEELVHAATGWDVLRAADQQGSTEALSFETANNMNRAALLAVHQRHFRLSRQATKKTMKEMLSDLFPKEARQADQAVTKKKAEKRRQDVMELRALREQVRTDLLIRC
jgi:hypothetical protein